MCHAGDNEDEASLCLQCPCEEPKLPQLSISSYICVLRPKVEVGVWVGWETCVRLCTRHIYQTRLLPFFKMLTRMVMPPSPLLQGRPIYIWPCMRQLVERGIRRVLFCWNDVLLAWMWQQNMNMKIWKERLSQRGSWYSWGLDIMCLLVWLPTVLYITSMDGTVLCGLLTV